MKRPQFKWNIDDIMDFVNEIEETFDVDTWILAGIHIWPVLRMQLALELNPLQPTHTKTKITDFFLPAIKKSTCFPLGIAKHVYFKLRDYKKNANLNRSAEAVFITYPNARRFKVESCWYDVYCDPLIDMISKRGIESLVLEYGDKFNYKTPRFNKSCFIQPRLTLLSYLSALNCQKYVLDSKIKSELNSLYVYLEERGLFGFTYDLSTLKMKIGYLRYVAEFFKKIFQKVRPKVVFGSNYYGIEKAINLACRELGITSVDIQHGVQGESHRAFARWKKVPQTGYELMPNIFLTWSSYEAETIRSWSKATTEWHQAIVSGNLLLEKFKQNDNQLVAHYDAVVRQILAEHKANTNILVTLSTDLGLPRLYRDLILCSSKDYFWWIRLHPVMSNKERKDILKIVKSFQLNNIYADSGQKFPLYAILRHMDLHITDNSSTVLECEAFGIPSILTHHSGKVNYWQQVKSGIAFYADTRNDILSYIPKVLSRSTPIAKSKTSFIALEHFIDSLFEQKII
jgi:hypothetical protein